METTGTKQYDLFKLIVAILLLLAFLFLLVLMVKQDGQTPPPPAPSTASATSTLLPPTETSSPISTITDTPQPTFTSSPTIEPTTTPTAIPTMTATSVPPVGDDQGEAPAEVSVCETIAKSRLKVGMQVIILQRLNFRTSPGILNNRVATNIPGTRAEVVGGPACTRYSNGGAYLWWQIKLPNGTIGWSAEASSFGTFYFIEPAK